MCVCADELLQQQGSDSALHSVWGVWTAVGGGCRGDGLLATDGGRNRTAAEPNCRCQDGFAFWPLESVFHCRCGHALTLYANTLGSSIVLLDTTFLPSTHNLQYIYIFLIYLYIFILKLIFILYIFILIYNIYFFLDMSSLFIVLYTTFQKFGVVL